MQGPHSKLNVVLSKGGNTTLIGCNLLFLDGGKDLQYLSGMKILLGLLHVLASMIISLEVIILQLTHCLFQREFLVDLAWFTVGVL